MIDEKFYRALEERLYAPREKIKKIREVYLPFVEPLKELYGTARACDIGCGRGEWLELLSGRGFEVRGIDLDEGMLVDCRRLGLPVERGDGIPFLRALPDESQGAVSAFHVVEHLAFEDLRTLVAEALRVLKPGGLLIIETPNPENIRVGTWSFYLDPTHKRPVPPGLLTFLTEYSGYARTKIMRLQEPQALAAAETASLLNVLNDVSPDYAVVAQKQAPGEMLAAFDRAFGREYGLTLQALANRHDARIDDRFRRMEADSANRIGLHEDRWLAVQRSLSWRITAPLRKVYAMFNTARGGRGWPRAGGDA